MIFVTVGTHEQQFDRLIKCIDELKEKGIITEEVIIQTGFSTYEPKFCKWKKLFQYQEMIKNVANARIVVTHGGPSSFIMPLQIGKIPIVVPRLYDFNEHVNNHQLDFAKEVERRQGNIICVENIEELQSVFLNYDGIIGELRNEMKSNNAIFNEKLEKIVHNLF